MHPRPDEQMENRPENTGEAVTKTCPACQTVFECKAGQIQDCFCILINLSATQRDKIAGKFNGCLCPACLAAYGTKQHLWK